MVINWTGKALEGRRKGSQKRKHQKEGDNPPPFLHVTAEAFLSEENIFLNHMRLSAIHFIQPYLQQWVLDGMQFLKDSTGLATSTAY